MVSSGSVSSRTSSTMHLSSISEETLLFINENVVVYTKFPSLKRHVGSTLFLVGSFHKQTSTKQIRVFICKVLFPTHTFSSYYRSVRGLSKQILVCIIVTLFIVNGEILL